MARTSRADTSPLLAGYSHAGNRGGGVLGEDIPSGGTHGASVIYNDLDLPADAQKEYMARITTWPTNGSLTLFEDGSGVFVPPPEGGDFFFIYDLYEDYINIGSGRVDLSYGGITGSTGVLEAQQADITGSAILEIPTSGALISQVSQISGFIDVGFGTLSNGAIIVGSASIFGAVQVIPLPSGTWRNIETTETTWIETNGANSSWTEIN